MAKERKDKDTNLTKFEKVLTKFEKYEDGELITLDKKITGCPNFNKENDYES